MSTVTLKKWGNSVGILIPASLLKKAHLRPGETFDVSLNEQGALTLTPVQDKQAGWTEQFNTIADSEDTGIMSDMPNAFDEEEWTW